jgi:hypothetical protein
VFATSNESVITFAEPHLSFPGDVTDRLGHVFLPDLDLTRDASGISIGPGSLDECPSSVAVTGFGDASESAFFSGGMFGRADAQIVGELAGVVEAGDVTHLRDGGDGYSELNTAKRLECNDEGEEFPAGDVIMEFVFESLEPLRAFRDGIDVLLESDLLCGDGEGEGSEPSEVSGRPVGTTGVSDAVSEEEGFQSQLGSIEISESIFPGAAEIPDGLVLDLGNIDGGEVPGAQEASKIDSIPSISFHPSAGFLGDERWSSNDAGIAFS